jgi:hypothetical protein
LSLLNLAYSPAVPVELLEEMESAAKRMGLPLATLERLGQSEHLCRAFVSAARRGDRERMEFLAGIVREVLEAPRPEPAAPEAPALG